ncbi:MAG: hypothetical protein ACREAD_02075 [Nitrosopumilaceae archaeon]
MGTNFKFCPVCGNPPPPPPPQQQHTPPQQYPPAQPNVYNQNNYYQNNPPITVDQKSEALAIVLSVLIAGVGQMYLGKIGRGVGILIGLIILAVIGIVTLGVGYILAIILFIWQIIDAYNLCKKYNRHLLQNGQPPW